MFTAQRKMSWSAKEDSIEFFSYSNRPTAIVYPLHTFKHRAPIMLTGGRVSCRYNVILCLFIGSHVITALYDEPSFLFLVDFLRLRVN